MEASGISVVIPVYNEEGTIGQTIRHLQQAQFPERIIEILVIDGGSTDGTIEEAKGAGATALTRAKKGRAAQMNFGAARAKGDVLYFLHADSRPPHTFPVDIFQSLTEGFAIGCYRLQFDEQHWFLQANAWFTRFDFGPFRFGDQSLFVQKAVFEKAGGFREDHVVMEDNEIIARLRKHGKFKIIPKNIITAARKYTENGPYKMQAIFFLIYFMYQFGFSQHTLVNTYRRLIRQDKV